MPEIKLKPCPFCGSRGRIMRAENNAYVVRCKDCGAQTARSFIKDWHRNKFIAQGNAAEAWNRRTDEVNEPLTLEELRNMNGEPVWMVSKINNTGEWGILRVHETHNSWFIGISGSCTVYGKDTYEKEWLAYRHKQQEGE